MIKKYSVAWQASGWLSYKYSRARSDLAFHKPRCLPGSLGFGSFFHPSFEEKEGADLKSMQKSASCFQGGTLLIILCLPLSGVRRVPNKLERAGFQG